MSARVDLFYNTYANFDDRVLASVRAATYGEDIGQNSWVTVDEYASYIETLGLDEHSHVLEVASGSGGPALHVAQRTGCRVTGVDVNLCGVGTASTLATRAGLAERLRFMVADATQPLPFEDDTFDALLCIDSMNHFPNRSDALKEWCRILKPGGRAIFTDPVVITGPVTNEELAARSSIGLFVFVPKGLNEELIVKAGFKLINQLDATENAACRASPTWRRNSRRPRELLYPLGPGQGGRPDGVDSSFKESSRVWRRGVVRDLPRACAPSPRSAIDGILVADEDIALTRGEQVDSARREFPVDGNATYVAMLEQDDTDLEVVLSHGGAQGVPAATIEIDAAVTGHCIEIAVLDAPSGSRLSLLLTSPQDSKRPGKTRLRLLRYDAAIAKEPRVAARLAAYRAWSRASRTKMTGEGALNTALQDIDHAIGYFESERNLKLAAWGRLVRSRLNSRQYTNFKISLADAEHAEGDFIALGDTGNAARARLQQANVMTEIANDLTAKEPTAAEAALRAKKILVALSAEPEFSDLERARAVNYRGVLAFHVYDLAESRARFLEVIPAFEAVGSHQGRLMATGNLGALATLEGDYRTATRYYGQVIDELFRFRSVSVRAMHLVNAGTIDFSAGNIDRSIERFMRALELTREHEMEHNEARALHGLGFAYWARGDTAQATALLGEALKLRRTIDDASGLMISLGANGVLAREAGDIPKALAMHREAASMAPAADMKMYTLWDLSLDYQAASDYPRAIATAREALAVHDGLPYFYKRQALQLDLADMLLSQPHRSSQALREAMALSQDSLKASIRHSDTNLEIIARRLLAQSHAIRGNVSGARDEYERAIALIFKYRSTINNPELRSATLSHEQQTFRGYVDLLMGEVARRGPGKLLPTTPAEEEALRTLEWARALNFDSRRFPQLEPASQARLDELLTLMAGKRVRIASLRDQSPGSTREAEALQVDIARLRVEVDRLRAAAREGHGKIDESPLGAPPWPAIPAGVTQISYAIETQNAYVWVRDSSGLRAGRLAAAPADIARELGTFAKAVRARTPAQVDSALLRLSTSLLPAGLLDENSATLEIVAEGQIATVPFAALTVPSEPTQRLSQHRSIVMIGSLFAPRTRPKPASARKWGFVALANDARSSAETPASRVFSTLPTTNAEARSIAAMFQKRNPPPQVKLLFGADGNANGLKAVWHDGVDAIHFATHGLADLRQPLASLLLLPALDAAGNPTYLTAGQVQEWRGDADLVYLSACETAVGPARFAEGLPGLQRAFLRAGARGVIATLWPVEDVYASQFAADFYRRFTGGTTASQSLSETQRAWAAPLAGAGASEQAHRRLTAWAHVFFAP